MYDMQIYYKVHYPKHWGIVLTSVMPRTESQRRTMLIITRFTTVATVLCNEKGSILSTTGLPSWISIPKIYIDPCPS
jgi:hypothetical protein